MKGKKMPTGDTQRIRIALIKLSRGGKEVTNADLATALDMVFNNEKQTLYRTLRAFHKRGEIEKKRRGVYKYIGKTSKPQLQQIMWRALRARKTIEIDDLIEIAGASRAYIKEFLRMLVKREIVRLIRIGKKYKYQIINDPVIMPEDTDNAKKLRKLRQQKKAEALAALKEAESSIKKAKEIINNSD